MGPQVENTSCLGPLGFWFLGIDVAGAKNTWAVGLRREGDGAVVEWGPARRTLQDIVNWARAHRVLAAAIDAQLTAALTNENGFRPCDLAMRQRLASPKHVTWVASFNSLMAVPVRGRVLAEALAPFVGTMLETHPRFALWAGLDQHFDTALETYKAKHTPREVVRDLADAWKAAFPVGCPVDIADEGALDADRRHAGRRSVVLGGQRAMVATKATHPAKFSEKCFGHMTLRLSEPSCNVCRVLRTDS